MMKLHKLHYLLILWLFSSCPVRSQTIDKISQLISAENYFAALAKGKGVKKAFLKVSDDNTLVFRPGPVKAVEYYKDQEDSLGVLEWTPVYARIAKSADWGFTTGPYTYRENDNSAPVYGDYLSVWKKNGRGVWKLALDLGVPHKRPTTHPDLVFLNPRNETFLHQRSQNRLRQREDLVFSSDKLLATIQKADNKIARNEFLDEDCRLLFPGFEPIIGKAKISAFFQKQGFRQLSEPAEADRSYSGELALTRGTANFSGKGKNNKFHYVRIWEVQDDYKWNVILEIYTPASEEENSLANKGISTKP